MGNIGKATEHVYQQPVTTNTSDWHLFDSPLYSQNRTPFVVDIGDDMNTKSL